MSDFIISQEAREAIENIFADRETAEKKIEAIESQGYKFSGVETRNMILQGSRPWGGYGTFDETAIRRAIGVDVNILTFENDKGLKRYCIIDENGGVINKPLSQLNSFDRGVRERQNLEDPFYLEHIERNETMHTAIHMAEMLKTHNIEIAPEKIAIAFGFTTPDEAQKILETAEDFVKNFDRKYNFDYRENYAIGGPWTDLTFTNADFFHQLYCGMDKAMNATEYMFTNSDGKSHLQEYHNSSEAGYISSIADDMMEQIAANLVKEGYFYDKENKKLNGIHIETANAMGVGEALIKDIIKNNDRNSLNEFLKTEATGRDGAYFKEMPGHIVTAIMESDVKKLNLDRINKDLRNIPTLIRKYNKDITDNEVSKQVIKEYITSNHLNSINYSELMNNLKTKSFTDCLKNGDTLSQAQKKILMADSINRDASDELKNDKEVVMIAISNNGKALEYASDELKNNKEIVMTAVANDGQTLRYASEKLKADKEVVMVAISNDGKALEYASDELKNDKEIVMAAVTKDGHALEYTSEKLRADKEVVLVAVVNNGKGLKLVSEELQNDKDVVMAAVSDYGCALQYASWELKSDKEVVMAAVTNDNNALYHARYELRNDIEFCAQAIMANPEVKNCLLNDRKHVIENVKVLQEMKKRTELHQTEREAALQIVAKKCEDFRYIPKSLREDKEFVIDAASNNGGILEYVSKEMRADKEIVMAAVSEMGSALKYASEELRADKEVVFTAVANNIRGLHTLEYASDELKADKEIVMMAVSKDWDALYEASEELKADKEVVMTAVIMSDWPFKFASENLKNDTDFCIQVVMANPKAIYYVPKDIREQVEGAVETLKEMDKEQEMEAEAEQTADEQEYSNVECEEQEYEEPEHNEQNPGNDDGEER